MWDPHVYAPIFDLYEAGLLFHVSDKLHVGYLYFHALFNHVVTHLYLMRLHYPAYVVFGVKEPSSRRSLEVVLSR